MPGRSARISAHVALALMTLVFAQMYAQAQTLKNPGFETPGQTLVSASDTPSGKAQIGGSIAEGWSDNTSWADVSLVYSLSAVNPRSGRNAQKIEIKRGFAQFAQVVQLPGGYYRGPAF